MTTTPTTIVTLLIIAVSSALLPAVTAAIVMSVASLCIAAVSMEHMRLHMAERRHGLELRAQETRDLREHNIRKVAENA